jgi:hypothetical protein
MTSPTPAGALVTDTAQLLIGQFPGQSFGATMDVEYVRVWNRILTPQETRSLAGNPWQIYRQPPASNSVNVPSGTTHTSTGALTGPGAAIAGTASRFVTHPSSGALTGPGSTVAGTALRFRTFSATGALVGPGSAIAGSAARSGAPVTHPSSGVLTGPGASISGQASRQSRIDGGFPLTRAQQEGLRKHQRKKAADIEAAWAQRDAERKELGEQLRSAARGPEPVKAVAPQPIQKTAPKTIKPIRDSEDEDIEFLLLHA